MNNAELSDNLILKISKGDKAAFRELYELTKDAVYGFALSLMRNREDAEDVMHDSFIKIYTGAGSYTPQGKALSWVLTIVRNLALSRLRERSMAESREQYGVIDIDETSTELVQDGDEMLDKLVLRTALNVLAMEEREIVTLHALTGYKFREISELLKMPIGTVESKYRRALAKMKDEINGKEAAE